MLRLKYGNLKTKYDGFLFDSKKESQRYIELKLMERAGMIKKLTCQPKYDITINDQPVCVYRPDFQYMENGKLKLEDVKGFKGGSAWAMFRVKQKLMKAVFDLDVLVV